MIDYNIELKSIVLVLLLPHYQLSGTKGMEGGMERRLIPLQL